MSIAVSKELKTLSPTRLSRTLPISTGGNVSGVSSESSEQGSNVTTPLTMLVIPPLSSTPTNHLSVSGNTMARSIPVSLSPSPLNLLLEFLPHFLLVLSLKGAFLCIALSVRLVLGDERQALFLEHIWWSLTLPICATYETVEGG